MIQDVTALSDAGFRVIPLDPTPNPNKPNGRGWKPALSGWTVDGYEGLDDAQVQRWFKNGRRGVGVFRGCHGGGA